MIPVGHPVKKWSRSFFANKVEKYDQGCSLIPTCWKKVDSEWGVEMTLSALVLFSQKLTSDSDSSTQITFDQTLSNVTICLFGPYFSEKNAIQNFEKLTSNSDSPIPITSGKTIL